MRRTVLAGVGVVAAAVLGFAGIAAASGGTGDDRPVPVSTVGDDRSGSPSPSVSDDRSGSPSPAAGHRSGSPSPTSGRGRHSDDGPSHDADDDHGSDGPSHDVGDDHGGRRS